MWFVRYGANGSPVTVRLFFFRANEIDFMCASGWARVSEVSHNQLRSFTHPRLHT